MRSLLAASPSSAVWPDVDRRIAERLLAGTTLAIAAAAEPAAAHAPFPGIGQFYNGLIHPFLSLPEFLLLVSASLLLGRSGSPVAGTGLLALAVAIVAGMALPWTVPGLSIPSVATLSMALACAAALSLDVRPPKWIVLAASGLSGICIGAALSPDSGPLRIMVAAGTGSALASAFLALVVTGVTFKWHDGWKVVAIRVVGAWVCAVGMMTLALYMRR